ncbi:hypothetical protein H0H93_011813, partial [Arthromyces matolae]
PSHWCDGNDDNVFTSVVTPLSLSPSPSQRPVSSYTIAKQPPFKNVTVDRLASVFGAVDFNSALKTFILASNPRANIFPNFFDTYNVYKQIVVTLPPNPYVGTQVLTNRIRCTPATMAKGRKLGSPAHFDLPFVIEDRMRYQAEGGLAGLRVAQIRAIFNLPTQFGPHRHPLAYVEWFTQLGRVDPVTGLHTISRSTRQRRRNTAVVHIDVLKVAAQMSERMSPLCWVLMVIALKIDKTVKHVRTQTYE